MIPSWPGPDSRGDESTAPTRVVRGDRFDGAGPHAERDTEVDIVSRERACQVAPQTKPTTVLPRIETDGPTVRLVVEERGRYEPVKKLGVGGMGEVVLVRDRDISRTVAQKRLLPELHTPAALARFVEEIRTIGRLEHPNIVPIHDVGVDDAGQYFFVMKYVEGETLESVIEKLTANDPAYHNEYSLERRIEIFLGVLYALEYAHEKGIVHRDVKPANVIVGRYGEVMLMDWGIAKPISAPKAPSPALVDAAATTVRHETRAATGVGSIIGTPTYMSPEQALADNDRVDARSDLYSAAVLFHELVTLRHYLSDKTSPTRLLVAVASEEFTFEQLSVCHASQARPPAELLHVIVKALAKDPSERYQTAGELIAALKAILEGKFKVQCSATFAKRAVRELGCLVDGRPRLALAGLLTLAAAVVFTGVQLARAVL